MTMLVAVISTNRPEVLSNIAAMQLNGCIGTPLHPLGSLDDHAYVLETGKCVHEGPAEDLLEDPVIKEVYLGH